MHKPINLNTAPQARSSIQHVPVSTDISVASNHCKQQAMFGKCTRGIRCPLEHVNYPLVSQYTKGSRRPLPGHRTPRPDNLRSRANKIKGLNVPRDVSGSRSTGGLTYLSRDSSNQSVNSHGSRTGRSMPQGRSPSPRGGPRRPASPGKYQGSSTTRGRSTTGQARSTTATNGKTFSTPTTRSPSSAGFRSPSYSSNHSKSDTSSGGEYSPRGTTKNCREWMSTAKCKDRESKDNKCKYNHPILCTFFAAGSCKKGDDCNMMHWDPSTGKGVRPTYDKNKGKGRGRQSSSKNSIGNSPRALTPRTQGRNDNREKKYTEKRSEHLKEFKDRKRSDRKGKGGFAKIAMITAAVSSQTAAAVPGSQS